MIRLPSIRRGITLLELLAIVMILGIVTAVSIGRLSPDALSNVGSQTDARRLALDLLCAQRRAIATGDNHYLQFVISGGQLQGYATYRVVATGDVMIDGFRPFVSGLKVTGTQLRAEFTFEGSALATYQYTLAAPDRAWQVSVIPVTGSVRVAEL